MYTALLLDDLSQSSLISMFGHDMPVGWEIICHHMTINTGEARSGPAADMVGQRFKIVATAVAKDERVMAVSVETDAPCNNGTKHITVAVNRAEGGRSRHSNLLRDWKPMPPLQLSGTVEEVS